MTGLARLQRDFAAAIQARDGAVEAHLAARAGLPSERGIAIYAHAYRARLLEALRDGFGHTADWLGDERFARLAAEFVAACPPRHASLRGSGDRFPRWLATRLPGSPGIAELAALDHALRAAFDGPDARTLTPASLARRVDDGDVPIEFVPTLRLLEMRHNTLAVWHALDAQVRGPRLERLPHPIIVAVWRIDWRPHFRSVPAPEARAMGWVGAGTTLESLCGRQARRDPSPGAAAQVGELLRRWMEDAMLRDDREHAARGRNPFERSRRRRESYAARTGA